MKKEQLLILATLSISIFSFAFIILYLDSNNAQAQVDPTIRYFAKDFCINEKTMLDGINYQNGDELSYGSQGCPISQIDIQRWNELSTVSKTIINSRMATNGYSDVTNQVQQALR